MNLLKCTNIVYNLKQSKEKRL